MKILITGAAGYLGSKLTSLLLALGHEMTAFDAMHYGAESLFFALDNPKFKLIKGDIRDEKALTNAVKSVDCIVHLAAIVGEPACNLDSDLAMSINCDAVKLLTKIANDQKLSRLIFTSTCSNYGVSKPNELVDENSQLNPLSNYAKAKVAVEQHLLTSCKIPFTILRLGTLCGISSRMRFDLLINEMSRSVALGEEIEIYSPQAWRPYLEVSDAAKAIAATIFAEEKIIDRNIFNVVGQNLQKSDLAKIVTAHYPNIKIKITDKAPDLRDYRVNGEKFSKTFYEFPKNSIEDSLLSMTSCIKAGYFVDPKSPIHSAIPIKPFHK